MGSLTVLHFVLVSEEDRERNKCTHQNHQQYKVRLEKETVFPNISSYLSSTLKQGSKEMYFSSRKFLFAVSTVDSGNSKRLNSKPSLNSKRIFLVKPIVL